MQLPDFLQASIAALNKNPEKRHHINGQDEFMKGQLNNYKPIEAQQNLEAQRIQNALGQAREPYAADEARLRNEMSQAQIKQMQEKNMYGDLTGEVGNALKVAMLERQLGSEDPRVIAAKEQLKLQQDSQRQRNEYTQQLAEQAPKRNSTAQGKLLQELAEINAGFRPGSDYGQALDSEEQAYLKGQYELALLNKNTDTDTRKRTLLASNIDKTLEAFDVKDLTRYAGVKGNIEKKIEQGKALTERESEEYRKYEDSLTAVDLLASQIRQFYGDSVTTSMRQHLEELTNPSTWVNNPRIAERKFNTLKEILRRETSTYRGALKDTREFGEHKQSEQPEQQFSQADLEFTAKKRGMTVDQVKELLSKRK